MSISDPTRTIPNEDLTRQYAMIADEIMAAVKAVLPTGRYTLGPFLAAFEKEFAEYCGTEYCLGIANGTEALHLALAACGVGPGDEVISVPNTYAATIFAISYVDATPVFVDVDPDTLNMDPALIEAAITPRTKAILPVHLYGHPVDMDPVLKIAEKHGLYVIEDAAHAHGALYKGRKAGSLSHVGCFSFYPAKNLGAYGDGGAVTLNDETLFERLKMYRYMGQKVKHQHEFVGFQQRLDEVQAAILSVKLRHLDAFNAARARIAGRYNAAFADLPVKTPVAQPYCDRHVYYMYSLRVDPAKRDALRDWLVGSGIGIQVIYPNSIHLQPAYQRLGLGPGSFPVAERARDEVLNLPVFPELRDDEQDYVIERVRAFFGAV
ncbi:MAG: DegT/DnrJ/EryC1/StrS family aminotransferase [Anaerolineae bacterium]|nr:DegT/DnrJ/EryC1/StrS family aminotransferase [Anaerolineae bacterium]